MPCLTGITTVCDMGSIGEAEEVWEGLEQVYMPAADRGELPIRVFAMVPLTTWYCPSVTYFVPLSACKEAISQRSVLTYHYSVLTRTYS